MSTGAIRLSGALGGLVEATRRRDATRGRLTRHIQALALPQSLELAGPSHLRVGDKEIEQNNEEGRWLFDAFMAGLKGLEIGAQAEQEQLLELAEMLASLRGAPEPERVLSDWYFEHQGEGISLQIQTGFHERLEGADLTHRSAGFSMGALRVGISALSQDGVELHASELDRAAPCGELEVSDLYDRQIASRELEMTGKTLKLLSATALDATRWSRLMSATLAETPALRRAVSPARAAAVALDLLRQAPDEQFLQSALSMGDSSIPHDQQTSRLIQEGLASALVGAFTRRQMADPSPLYRLLPEEQKTALVREAQAHAEGAALLSRLARAEEFRAFLARLDPASMNEDQGAWANRVLGQGEGRRETLSWALALEGDALAAFVDAQGDDELEEVLEHATQLLRTGHPVSKHLIDRFLAHERASELLERLFLETERANLDEAGATAMLRALRQTPSGREKLVIAARRSKLPERLRVRSLQALAGDRDAQQRASEWSWREWFEPEGLRQAKQTIRKRLKSSEPG